MEARFWQLEQLSDQQLLERLQGVLQTKRRTLAELIAQLGEVEERRLHSQAACSSLFAYCVQRLGMSEDEACRRIEVARLARRFPALFAELASGGLTLSVALLLKRVLSADNHLELIAAVRGASTERARELLAARFPSPDVPSGIRKLPERRGSASPPSSEVVPERAVASIAAPMTPIAASSQSPRATPRQPEGSRSGLQQRIEPLSAGRYRVQFTADASLKLKLDQARDLLRHAQPNGDLAAIVSRALDRLLEELMGRRFGKLRKDRVAKSAGAPTAAPPAAPQPAPPGVGPQPPSHVARAARRAVLQRDGLCCSWVDANGQRCGSTAWLELDHCHPAGKGGSAEPENLRMLCRAHNRFAAERAYGRAHIEQAIRARQRSASSQRPRVASRRRARSGRAREMLSESCPRRGRGSIGISMPRDRCARPRRNGAYASPRPALVSGRCWSVRARAHSSRADRIPRPVPLAADRERRAVARRVCRV